MQGLEAKGPIARAIFRAGFAANQHAMQRGGRAKLWDMILFKKLQGVLGGRLKIMLTGMCVCMCMYVCVCMYMCMYVRLFKKLQGVLGGRLKIMLTGVCVCMCVCICMCMYVCMFV